MVRLRERPRAGRVGPDFSFLSVEFTDFFERVGVDSVLLKSSNLIFE